MTDLTNKKEVAELKKIIERKILQKRDDRGMAMGDKGWVTKLPDGRAAGYKTIMVRGNVDDLDKLIEEFVNSIPDNCIYIIFREKIAIEQYANIADKNKTASLRMRVVAIDENKNPIDLKTNCADLSGFVPLKKF